MIRKRLPSPALVVALLALFVALSGTAVAAGVVHIVPLAKRALSADNAKKLDGVSLPGIVAGVPALVTVRTQSWSLNGGGQNDFSAACNTGEKAIAGGYDNPAGDAISVDNRPSSDDTSWKIFLANLSSSAPASGTIYAVCLA